MEPVPPTKLRRGSVDPAISRSDAASSIVLIDDRPLVRHCVSQWLEEYSRDTSVIALASPADAFDDVRVAKEANLIVYSIGAARVADPEVLDNIHRLAQSLPNVPIILLSDRDNVEEVAKALRHGVRGYIPTSLEVSELAAAIQCVEAGGAFVPADTLIPSCCIATQFNLRTGDGDAPPGRRDAARDGDRRKAASSASRIK